MSDFRRYIGSTANMIEITQCHTSDFDKWSARGLIEVICANCKLICYLVPEWADKGPIAHCPKCSKVLLKVITAEQAVALESHIKFAE